MIQSQDENTIIEDYVVNRGNCGDKVSPKYVLNDEYGKALDFDCVNNSRGITVCMSKFCVDNKNKEFCVVSDNQEWIIFRYFLDKQGNKIKGAEAPKEIYSNNIDFYNNLHDDFKKFYSKTEHKLGFGKSMAVKTKCSADRIMEIELTLNGGKKVTYKFDPQYGGF